MNLKQYFNWDALKAAAPELCRDCGSADEAVGNCASLEELFTLWSAAQACELGAMENADNARYSTFPDLKKYHGSCALAVRSYGGNPALRKAMLGHFCRDGFVEEGTGKADTALFVFRESNISDDVTLDGGQIALNQAEKFWLEEQWDKKGSDSDNKDPYVTFMEQHMKWAEADIGHMSIRRIAVMNLNKRGGFGTCRYARLRHYAEVYRPFIQREIAIINPKIIFCGGTFGTVKNLLPNELANRVEVWDCYHPSAWKQQKADQIKKWIFQGTA